MSSPSTWHCISISTELEQFKRVFVKFTDTYNSYKIQVTNLENVWTEHIDAATLLKQKEEYFSEFDWPWMSEPGAEDRLRNNVLVKAVLAEDSTVNKEIDVIDVKDTVLNFNVSISMGSSQLVSSATWTFKCFQDQNSGTIIKNEFLLPNMHLAETLLCIRFGLSNPPKIRHPDTMLTEVKKITSRQREDYAIGQGAQLLSDLRQLCMPMSSSSSASSITSTNPASTQSNQVLFTQSQGLSSMVSQSQFDSLDASLAFGLTPTPTSTPVAPDINTIDTQEEENPLNDSVAEELKRRSELEALAKRPKKKRKIKKGFV